MAGGTPVFFSKGVLLISNGATPPVFEAWCGITQLTKTSNKETGTVNMPDCDNPDLPGWLLIYLISNQMSITGAGTVATESLPDWDSWDRLGDYRTARWYRDLTSVQGGGYYEGPALLTAWEESADIRAPYTFSFGVTFNGQPIWHPAP